MNQFLAAAPRAEVVHSGLACLVSLNDLADRPPRAVDDGEVLDIGGRRLRFLATPHVPHSWESGIWYEETDGTLFVGDLFSTVGEAEPLVTEDLIDGARVAEEMFRATSMGPDLDPTLHRLADLEPTTLALMHGPSFRGDGAAQLRALADVYAARALVAG